MTAFRARPLRHLAAVLDGNRRWAAERGLPPEDGYRAGADRVMEFLPWCTDAGIEVVTLMAASADNLVHRDPLVMADALETIVTTLGKLAATGRYRLRPIGRLARLGPDIEHALNQVRERTAQVAGTTVNIAIGYGGREEITDAVRSLLTTHLAHGTLHSLPQALAPQDIAAQLYTADQPDPDLIIRTSGEQRLSTLMPWQSVYSELFFLPVNWPDLTLQDFLTALTTYHHRQRRFGA
ncbi:polyprenyl diphosphate synthase [Streptomyces cavernae]|uniref:polyprenyl diphosphate synthase n=1 Tax=Streptomyces cavernae TaxID=2259034 RepID=UPI00192E4B3E|nr:polyprenyl diphosphate synthase [Streptomyces cavernae]